MQWEHKCQLYSHGFLSCSEGVLLTAGIPAEVYRYMTTFITTSLPDEDIQELQSFSHKMVSQ